MQAAQTGGGRESDERFMRIALRLAGRMLGATAPNPAVGAVIVDESTGELIARGWTQRGGRPHAETHVIERAGGRAAGKTMYVTLEPCSHHGQTPPCAGAIAAAGLARVVCAIQDPDTRVSGRGLAMLRAAGIAVDVGVCGEEARWVTAGHIMRMQARRPFVTLKLAVSADGRIARGSGTAPTWVTSPTARAHGHLLRAQSDAMLVGRKTIVDDDPELTCRLPGLEARSPLRYVLDSGLRVPPGAKVLSGGGAPPTILIAAIGVALPPHVAPEQVRRVTLVAPGRLDLTSVLASMSEDGVTRLLVEGGPTLAQALLEADLVDETVIFHGAHALGEAGIPVLGGAGLAAFDDTGRWQLARRRALGDETITTYRSTHPW